MPPGDAWQGWSCSGVANLRVQDGRGLLEAGSDVFPCDPRPVAFAIDQRFRDGTITATAEATGAGAGVVLRRLGPRAYYAAILDDEQGALVLVRRLPSGVQELARTAWTRGAGPVELSLRAHGADPTTLTATAGIVTVSGRDSEPSLQRAGDPGVLATARTLFPSSDGPVPGLGNLHLLPYGVQEGESFMQTAVGQEILDQIRERSTAVLSRVVIDPERPTLATPATVVAATNGAPLRGGGQVRVAADLPARVEIEYAANRQFKHSRVIRATHTGSFDGLVAEVRGMRPGTRVWWRARLRRRGRTTIGPARSFNVLPRPGSGRRTTIAIGACASQFGPIFDHLLARKPDLFVWQGDLNYPDTIGPLAQTMAGYAGIWRDFLANPRLAPVIEHALFAPQHDDHDYGVQDSNSTNLVPWGIAPWNALLQPKLYYGFSAGVADFWVLDQRRFKSAP
ncbi:MAG: alkaline phosphatase, partial [Thermoleophilaceae bacterium]|nr:alkaline phosphatase [Thermoleophilaceae bacterium]